MCNFCQGQNHLAKTCPGKRRNARVNAIEEDEKYVSKNQVHLIGKNEGYDTQDEMYIFTLEDEKCEIDDVKNYNDDDNDDNDDENNEGYHCRRMPDTANFKPEDFARIKLDQIDIICQKTQCTIYKRISN